MDNRSPFLMDRATASIDELKAAARSARIQFEQTRAYPDWEIACEAQGRYLASVRKRANQGPSVDVSQPTPEQMAETLTDPMRAAITTASIGDDGLRFYLVPGTDADVAQALVGCGIAEPAAQRGLYAGVNPLTSLGHLLHDLLSVPAPDVNE